MKAAPAQFQPANLGLCTTALALATFMQVLDTTIANVSLPTIAGNLGVSVMQNCASPLSNGGLMRVGLSRYFCELRAMRTLA